MKPRILFEDANLIVVDKPAGLLSQGEHKGEPNLVDWLRTYLGRRYVGLVHRLDRNASGLMVVAKRSKAAARLTRALQQGKIIRKYRVWLVGTLKKPKSWMHYLLKDKRTNQVKVVPAKKPGSKEAVLRVKPIAHAKWKGTPLTLAEFQLKTGRSHQIRVQSAAEGYPVLGDRKYGGLMFSRLALHSFKIVFEHPIHKKIMSFEASLPEAMKQGLMKTSIRRRR